jgi:hypothetical protein
VSCQVNEYFPGNTVRLQALFTDPEDDDAPIDPATIVITIENKDGDETQITNMGLMVNPTVGTWYYDYTIPDASPPGNMWYAFDCDDTADCFGEGRFKVLKSRILDN